MASLTYTAYVSRKLIKFGSIGLVAFAILWMGSKAAITAYKAAHPVYVAPTIKYGILPKIVFPDKTFTKKNFTKELQNDAFPTFKDQAKVYVVYRSNRSFLALEEDTKTAIELGFPNAPVEIDTNIYEFKNSSNQTLTMNIADGSFKLSYPYQTDQLLLTPEKVPNKNEATETASSFLRSAGKLSTDLENGEKIVTFWKISTDGIKAVEAQSEANAVRIDFFRQNVDTDFKIVSSEPNRAAVSILVSGSSVADKRIIEVSYKYSPVDRESFSTYPLKTVDQAWIELTEGNYWPASDVSVNNVVIRDASLAYFEPVSLTNYMEPVYVFEGDGGFVAYVPAIDSKYVENSNP